MYFTPSPFSELVTERRIYRYNHSTRKTTTKKTKTNTHTHTKIEHISFNKHCFIDYHLHGRIHLSESIQQPMGDVGPGSDDQQFSVLAGFCHSSKPGTGQRGSRCGHTHLSLQLSAAGGCACVFRTPGGASALPCSRHRRRTLAI